MRHCYQVQRLNMKAQVLLWCRPYQCQLSYCTYICMLHNLMRNWSLENVSDGYGRNLVQVYVSILSITLVQQLGHSLGYGELLQLACWISLPLASASVSSLWSYFENELCWEGILVLRASSVFDSIDCYFKSLLLRRISWIWKHFVDDPSFTSS